MGKVMSCNVMTMPHNAGVILIPISLSWSTDPNTSLSEKCFKHDDGDGDGDDNDDNDDDDDDDDDVLKIMPTLILDTFSKLSTEGSSKH